MEAYVDDMIVKGIHDVEYRQDLRKTFEILRTYGMKLNLKKCVFGVRLGKFMGLVIYNQGIEANPGKVKAVLDRKPPQNIKKVQ